MSVELELSQSDTSGPRKAGLSDTRHHNLGLVLRALFEGGELSRAEIGRKTLLTKVTVSDLVAELLEDGVVEQLETRTSSGRGKPATPVRVAATGRHIAVLDLARPSAPRGALVDLSGQVVAHEERSYRQPVTPAQVAEFAGALAASSPTRVLGIGIGTPGAIHARGVIASAPRLGWSDVPLTQIVERATGLPVATENDANCAILAERRYGGASRNVVLIQIATGLGAGVLVDGRFVRGVSGAAGEIGHLVVEPGGRECPCGRSGCLETYVSAPALSGEPSGRDRASAGRRLGAVLSPIVAMLDLEEIIVSGPEAIVGAPLLEALRASVLDTVAVDFRPRVVVRASRLEDDAVLLGAAAVVLRERLAVF